MTPEEKFNSEVWWALQKIRTEELQQPTGEPIEIIFQVRFITGVGIPPIEVWQKMLFKIQELGGIKIVDSKTYNNAYGADFVDTIKILQPKFDEIYKEFNPEKNDPKINSIPEVYYNNKTGVGFAGNKRFKFKNHQPEFKIFAEMHKSINNPILKIKVLELGNQDTVGEDVKTYFINELAKKMRKRTGLTKDNIVNNNGDLTLVAEIIQNAPK